MPTDPASKGIYKRGRIYWLAYQKDHKRTLVSLETSDYAEANLRA